MKEDELRKHATCSLCKQPIAHTGLPLFWIVKLARWGLQLRAIQRQTGLAMLLDSPRLAQVMGQDEEMATRIFSVALTICEKCAMERDLPVAVLAEMVDEESEDQDEQPA